MGREFLDFPGLYILTVGVAVWDFQVGAGFCEVSFEAVSGLNSRNTGIVRDLLRFWVVDSDGWALGRLGGARRGGAGALACAEHGCTGRLGRP